jgi:hypothetical protein
MCKTWTLMDEREKLAVLRGASWTKNLVTSTGDNSGPLSRRLAQLRVLVDDPEGKNENTCP